MICGEFKGLRRASHQAHDLGVALSVDVQSQISKPYTRLYLALQNFPSNSTPTFTQIHFGIKTGAWPFL